MQTPPLGDKPSQEPERPANDSVRRGVVIAMLCQLACMLAGIVAFALQPKFFSIFVLSWGLITVIVLIPLFVVQRKSGRSLTAKGILILGSIAFLLNAGCDAIVRFALGIR